MRERVFFFDVLRCIAALAVVAIHVLAPYRHGLDIIPFDQWFTAVTVNGASRWAVPVFIMITGALMLSDSRPFELGYYLKRRVGKVVVPFLIWSVFYALLSAWNIAGFDFQFSLAVLADLPFQETYYHLGFFYYFIPLYLVVPFLRMFVQQDDNGATYALLGAWFITCGLFLAEIEGIWNTELWLFSGYLLLGYLLFQRVAISPNRLWVSAVIGGGAIAVSVGMVVANSVDLKGYDSGRWFSYNSLNTVVIAATVFYVFRGIAEQVPQSCRTAIVFMSRHSLGIYLLHPLFLWPMKTFAWYQGHPGWLIPMWVLLSVVGSLLLSWVLSLSNKTKWLVP
ncbi:acyltransferase [Vibrio sp. Of7-15]|uniref:acyltransferase n=1 Tax=Vibrio sp. Of7-15 TaxID=2724879 RepID=UPI001EF259F4|nr:acyltransferase [Vibrio sp. Of7-15]MCG7498900.1 acyltransferase [Vibrio sp. Of7-15]